jgi:hypothetical protein
MPSLCYSSGGQIHGCPLRGVKAETFLHPQRHRPLQAGDPVTPAFDLVDGKTQE